MGTPDFSVPVLQALLDAGHDVVCVYTQPPRPAGRGKKLRPSPVHQLADQQGIEVRHPENLKDPADQAAFCALEVDAAVVVAYGLILPKAVLQSPKYGCVNVHASLLPRWRGAAPIQRAILAGDTETGVTIMAMDEGLDTGDMLSSEVVAIEPQMTAEDLHDALCALGAQMIDPALQSLADGSAMPVPQPEEGVTYAEKLSKDEARLCWNMTAEELLRKVRAFTPWPGAWFEADGERLKVIDAETVTCCCTPGFVMDESLTVGCGRGALKIKSLQRPGKKPMNAEDFQRGRAINRGTHLPY